MGEHPLSRTLKIRVYDDDLFKDDKIGGCKFDLNRLVATDEPQEFTEVVDGGFFSDATITFIVQTDGSFGNPPGGAGDLKIYIDKCTGLKDADWIGKTDPYCYCKCDDSGA